MSEVIVFAACAFRTTPAGLPDLLAVRVQRLTTSHATASQISLTLFHICRVRAGLRVREQYGSPSAPMSSSEWRSRSRPS
jgi:hypothetical protein